MCGWYKAWPHTHLPKWLYGLRRCGAVLRQLLPWVESGVLEMSYRNRCIGKRNRQNSRRIIKHLAMCRKYNLSSDATSATITAAILKHHYPAGQLSSLCYEDNPLFTLLPKHDDY